MNDYQLVHLYPDTQFYARHSVGDHEYSWNITFNVLETFEDPGLTLTIF